MEKIQCTFAINREIKNRFKVECVKNSITMSDALESMMDNYCSVSNELRETQTKQRELNKNI